MLRSAIRSLAVGFVALTFRAEADTFDGSVLRVVDGDSLIVEFQQQRIRVRLKEIDAPEIKQPFGKNSQQSLTTLCARKHCPRYVDGEGPQRAHAGPCMVLRDRRKRRAGTSWHGLGVRPLREGPKPVPIAGYCAINRPWLVGRRRAGAPLAMAASAWCARIPEADEVMRAGSSCQATGVKLIAAPIAPFTRALGDFERPGLARAAP